MSLFRKIFGPSFDELAEHELMLIKKQNMKKKPIVEPLIDDDNYDYEAPDRVNLFNNKFLLYLLYTFCIFIILFAVVYFTSFYNPKGITLNEFNKIQIGMTYPEVKEIINEDGVLISSVDLSLGNEFSTQLYMWYGNDNISNANIMFQGGKVISKTQLLLK